MPGGRVSVIKVPGGRVSVVKVPGGRVSVVNVPGGRVSAGRVSAGLGVPEEGMLKLGMASQTPGNLVSLIRTEELSSKI